MAIATSLAFAARFCCSCGCKDEKPESQLQFPVPIKLLARLNVIGIDHAFLSFSLPDPGSFHGLYITLLQAIRDLCRRSPDMISMQES